MLLEQCQKQADNGGGTYAHSDIAMAFATWISPEFQLYIMKDYRRLKQDENSRLSLDWNLNRALSKVNYRIHTDAVKENLIPLELTPEQIAYTYASEADLLNVALLATMQIDGYSLDAQKTKMKAFCDYNEYEIAGEYEDAGKSGKSIEGRFANK